MFVTTCQTCMKHQCVGMYDLKKMLLVEVRITLSNEGFLCLFPTLFQF